MIAYVFLVRSVLVGFETVERKDDICLSFDHEPAETLIAIG